MASTATDFSQDTHLFKIGLNYRLHNAPTLTPSRICPPHRSRLSGTTLEIGARYVYGWGRFQKDLGIQGEGLASLASRLTYVRTRPTAPKCSRASTPPPASWPRASSARATANGKLNDEDWGVPFATFIPYSNTYSKVDDHIRYGVIDVGYDVWRDARFRVAPFVGYSILHQYMQGFGCTQIANPNSDCGGGIPFSVNVIDEDDTWQSMRLGTVVDAQIVPGLTLTADAAYLPYVRFRGTDDHMLRASVSPEWGNGSGAQLEVMLSVRASPSS